MVKKILLTFLILVITITLYLNFKLYYNPTYVSVGNSKINRDLVYQLNYLKPQLHTGAATEMQQLFPEGYVFLTALYALSWIELAEQLLPQEDLYHEAFTEINWAIQKLASEEAKGVFEETQGLPYGIFYTGWSNYVLGKKIRLQTSSNTDSTELLIFKNNCDEILTALANSKSPFLESYSGSCWPADMTVAMASIAIANDVFDGVYEYEITSWLHRVESKTDTLGLFPHASLITGAVKEGARGASQSLILNFLFEIDSVYAKSKFEIYQQNFLDYRFGLPGIREYPLGSDGSGDIDSGPIILGMGGAATIVGQRTIARFGEDNIAIGIRNGIEAFGISFTRSKKKSYLFGQLPMADAFIAWSNSIEASQMNTIKSNENWRWKFQLISLVILILCGMGIMKLARKGK